MNETKTNKIKKCWEVLLSILFLAFTLYFSQFHECWADEAQSFLLARDTSLKELFYYIKFEGTPPLWFLIIKIFILFGGTYSTFYLLPIFFMSLGVLLFETKIEAPWYIKVLLPFSYFIFYQYTIICRSYCLFFPILMLIALVYKERLDKPIRYCLLIYLLMNISLHGLFIAGSLYFLFIIEILKSNKKNNPKFIILLVIMFLLFFITTIITFPDKNCSFDGNGGNSISYILSEATIGDKNANINDKMAMILYFIIFVYLFYKLDFKEIFKCLVLISPVLLILNIITYQVWHVGIIFLLITFMLIISDQINTKFFKNVLFLILFIQVCWNIASLSYDYKNAYSASKEVAYYLKEHDIDSKEIYGLGYSVTAINPYFDNNIFANYNSSKSFYWWKTDKNYMTNDEMLDNLADVYIISKLYSSRY